MAAQSRMRKAETGRPAAWEVPNAGV